MQYNLAMAVGINAANAADVQSTMTAATRSRSVPTRCPSVRASASRSVVWSRRCHPPAPEPRGHARACDLLAAASSTPDPVHDLDQLRPAYTIRLINGDKVVARILKGWAISRQSNRKGLPRKERPLSVAERWAGRSRSKTVSTGANVRGSTPRTPCSTGPWPHRHPALQPLQRLAGKRLGHGKSRLTSTASRS